MNLKKLVTAVSLILIACLLVSNPVDAKKKKKSKKKSRYVVVDYEERYITTDVKITKREYLGTFYITHYCPCARCCGSGGGKVTASGTRPTAGRTVGVCTSQIPYGTELIIEGVEGYVAEDTGGGSRWNHLDVFCSSHSEALASGVSYQDVWAVKHVIEKKKVKVKVPILVERLHK